jgi:predicted kinase
MKQAENLGDCNPLRQAGLRSIKLPCVWKKIENPSVVLLIITLEDRHRTMTTPPTLYIFAGLPGTGKTSLARGLAAHLGCTYLRIDTIEQALRDLCSFNVEGEGYRLTYRIAADNLRLGTSVVADSCNPWELTRSEWRKVATDLSVPFIDIETLCSDPTEHQRRIEDRTSDIPNLHLPSWQDVLDREYHAWSTPRITINTAGITPEEACAQLLSKLTYISSS